MTARLTWIIGLLSAALLGFELSLMRILSYAQWHHFAYMIISVALLGFGASGTILYLFRSSVLQHASRAIAISTSLCALSLALCPALLSAIHVDPFLLVWDPSKLWHLALFYAVLFCPFFFGASTVGLGFMLHPEKVGRVYFANLIGSGIGSLGVVALMEWVHPSGLPYAMTIIAVPAVILAAHDRRRLRLLLAGACVLVLATFLMMPNPGMLRSQYKSLSKTLLLPDARITHSHVSPLGVLEVVESPALRYAPGLSLSYQGTIPVQRGVFSDGEWVGSILDVRDTSTIGMLRHSTFALPYQVQKHPGVLILGSGTGSEIHLALHFGALSVTAVEMNAGLVEMLSDTFRDEIGEMLNDNRVHPVVAEARSYLARQNQRYDVIILPPLEGFSASAAGTHALFENYLFTVESFRMMIDGLTESGILAVHTWMTYPPRSPVKTIAMMLDALRRSGFTELDRHFAAIRSWNSFSAIAKKSAFTEEEIESIREFCDQNGFDLVHIPGIRSDEVNEYHEMSPPYLYDATTAIIRGNGQEFFSGYPFYVEPAVDDRPYFSHFFKWEKLSELMKTYGSTEAAFFELGYVLLLATFVQLALFSFVLILVPLVVARASNRPGRALRRALVYFGSIGFGFMFVEMVMIQKFILFLGHPVYAVSAIIGSILIFSGLGSYVSERFATRVSRALRVAFLCILVMMVAYAAVLPSLFASLLFLPLILRVLLCVLLLAPLAFFMGFPFPLGLRLISREAHAHVPYAWGVNGYCSVIASSLSVILAMEFGFAAVLGLSVLMYGLAGSTFLLFLKVEQT